MDRSGLTRAMLLAALASGAVQGAERRRPFIACEAPQVTVSPTQLTPGALGSSIPISITTTAACDWTAQPDVPWIVVSPASGTGSGVATAFVYQNFGSNPRSGTISISGTAVRVSQQGAFRCPAYGLSVPAELQVGPDGAQDLPLKVETRFDCQWQATPSASWLVIRPDEASGDATRTIHVSALPNREGFDKAREGRISVNDLSIVVRQQGDQTCYTTSPPLVTLPAEGGRVRFEASGPSQCLWQVSASDFLTVSPAPFSGGATVTVEAGAGGESAREGSISLRGPHGELVETLVQQQGAGCVVKVETTLIENVNPGDTNYLVFSGGSWSLKVELRREGCALPVRATVPWIVVTRRQLTAAPPRFEVLATVAQTVFSRGGELAVAGRSYVFQQEGQPLTNDKDDPCERATFDCISCLFSSARSPLHYGVRDLVLARSARGRARVHDYYRFAPEVVRLLLGDAELRRRVGEALRRYEPLLSRLVAAAKAEVAEAAEVAEGAAEVAVPQGDFEEIDALLTAVGAAGSADLREAVVRARRELRDPAALRDFGLVRTAQENGQ